MDTRTALLIVTQLPARRSHHLNLGPGNIVRAYWSKVFPQSPLPEHEVKVWHNDYATETDYWAAANRLEQAALDHLCNLIDH